jgi:hypothetical protein
MEITEAVWEKRNLDKIVAEVDVASSDLNDFLAQAEELESEFDYIVLRIPTGDLNLLFALQSKGYFFAEALIKCRSNIKNLAYQPLYQRVLDVTTSDPVTPFELELVIEQVDKEMFTTDRISLDPGFGTRLGARRYVGMIKDELGAGAIMYSIKFRGEVAGFFILREKPNSNGEYLANLGGIFPKFQNVGLGMVMNILEIQNVANLGGRSIETTFSTNNRGALATHLELGYTLIEQKYILVKHRRLDG